LFAGAVKQGTSRPVPITASPTAKAPTGTGSRAHRQPRGYHLCSPDTPVCGNPFFWYKTSSRKELMEEGDEQIYDKQQAGGTYSRLMGYK